MNETESALPTTSFPAMDRLAFAFPANPAERVRLLIGFIITLAVGVGFAAGGQDLFGDADTLWHIAVGRDIWALKSFPHVDAYSHSFAGDPWIAKEWLSQIILYGAYALGGWNGVIVLTSAVLLIVLQQLYWPMSSQIKPIFAAAIAVVVLSLSGNVFLARPHIIVLPVLILFVHGVWTAARAGRAPSFWLLIAMCVWANMHGSFTFGFLVAGLAFLNYLYERRTLKSPMTRRWLVFLAMCPVASTVNPYGFEAIWSTVIIAKSEALPYIVEWRAFSAQKDFMPEMTLLLLFGAVIASGFRTNLITAVFVCFLVHMYFTHIRFVYLFFTLTPLLLVPDVAKQFEALSYKTWAKGVGASGFEAAMAKYAAPVVAATALLLVAGTGAALSFGKWTPTKTYPIAAIEAAREYGVKGNVINFYSFGGALIFERIPTFVDGRADRLFQGGFMQSINASRIAGGDEALREHIGKYNIGWAIYPPKDGRLKLLEAMPGWRKIYEDEYAVVYAADEPGK